jgi:hypothetical protein
MLLGFVSVESLPCLRLKYGEIVTGSFEICDLSRLVKGERPLSRLFCYKVHKQSDILSKMQRQQRTGGYFKLRSFASVIVHDYSPISSFTFGSIDSAQVR